MAAVSGGSKRQEQAAMRSEKDSHQSCHGQKKSRVGGGNESRVETERQRGELDFEEVTKGSKCWKEEEGGSKKRKVGRIPEENES